MRDAFRVSSDKFFDGIVEFAALGISGSTAAAWLSALEATHRLMVLDPWFVNRTKTLVKRPKPYLRDTGLAPRCAGFCTTAGRVLACKLHRSEGEGRRGGAGSPKEAWNRTRTG